MFNYKMQKRELSFQYDLFEVGILAGGPSPRFRFAQHGGRPIQNQSTSRGRT